MPSPLFQRIPGNVQPFVPIRPYNLAYINHKLHAGDNVPVVGYDNAHDGHHRHYFGVVEPVDVVSFEEIEERFEQDWIILKDCR